MNIVKTILKIFYFAALIITGLLNIFGGLIMAFSENFNMGISLCIVIFVLVGLGASFVFSLFNKWGIAAIISTVSSILVISFSYYIINLGFDKISYLRNHASIILVPVLAICIWIINKIANK